MQGEPRWMLPRDGVKHCFCVGPQPGETKCPCALRNEQAAELRKHLDPMPSPMRSPDGR